LRSIEAQRLARVAIEFYKPGMFVSGVFEASGLTAGPSAEFENGNLFHIFTLYSLSPVGKRVSNWQIFVPEPKREQPVGRRIVSCVVLVKIKMSGEVEAERLTCVTPT
jgi:hypothetical protein